MWSVQPVISSDRYAPRHIYFQLFRCWMYLTCPPSNSCEWNSNSQWKWRLIISCVNPTKRRKLMIVRWKAAKIWSMQHFWRPMINAKGWYLQIALWCVIHDTLLPTDSPTVFYSNDRYIESHQFCRDKVRKGCEQYQNNVYGCVNMVLVDHFSRSARVSMYCCYYYFLLFLLVSTICEYFPYESYNFWLFCME